MHLHTLDHKLQLKNIIHRKKFAGITFSGAGNLMMTVMLLPCFNCSSFICRFNRYFRWTHFSVIFFIYFLKFIFNWNYLCEKMIVFNTDLSSNTSFWAQNITKPYQNLEEKIQSLSSTNQWKTDKNLQNKFILRHEFLFNLTFGWIHTHENTE